MNTTEPSAEEVEPKTIFQSFAVPMPCLDPNKPFTAITPPQATNTKGGTDTVQDVADF